MMGWDGGGGGVMFGIGHLLWWLVVVAGIVLIARWLLDTGRRGRDGGEDRARQILRERFARGEIAKAEFEACKRDLG